MQIVFRRKGDGMECEIELSPALADGLKHGFELDSLAHVAGQEDRRHKLVRQRLHIALRLAWIVSKQNSQSLTDIKEGAPALGIIFHALLKKPSQPSAWPKAFI